MTFLDLFNSIDFSEDNAELVIPPFANYPKFDPLDLSAYSCALHEPCKVIRHIGPYNVFKVYGEDIKPTELEEYAARIIVAAATDRNMVVYDKEAESGCFTTSLVDLLYKV